MPKVYIVLADGRVVGVYTAKRRALSRAIKTGATDIEVWQFERFVENITDFT